jgi:hypothetical protein
VALVSQAAGGIATETRRGLEPFAAQEFADLIDLCLRDREGEPVEDDGKDTIVHVKPPYLVAIQAPVLPIGGGLACARSALAAAMPYAQPLCPMYQARGNRYNGQNRRTRDCICPMRE